MLDSLGDRESALAAVAEVWPLMEALFPVCRSITGDGVRTTLDNLERLVPLERTEVPSGTRVFDWEVPVEWNVRDAYIADSDGRRIVDFRTNSLHLMSYSAPLQAVMTRAELEGHLHSIPDHPEWIPYRTSYYREQWGFCLRHQDRERMGPGPFKVFIDSTLSPGHLTYAECVIPGTTQSEAIVYTHTCHPSLANDNLTGIAAAGLLARAMLKDRPRLTWRFVFGPGTIGSLTWLAMNEHRLEGLKGGLTIGLLGDSGALTYKRSRRGTSPIDRVAEYVLPRVSPEVRFVDFEPYGYDERQFCSPGFDLPVGRVTRSSNGQYPEYHTSADNLEFIKADALAESVQAIARLIAAIDENRTLENLFPKGEPRLGKRGLYGSTGGTGPGELEHAMLWVLSFSDGAHDLLAIAQRAHLDYALIVRAASALEVAGLVRPAESPSGYNGSTPR